MDEIQTAALLVEVNWGVIPEVAEGQERWGFTLEQVEQAKSWGELMTEAYDEFHSRLDPSAHNWVTLTWLWL